MIISSHSQPEPDKKLLTYLQTKLGLSDKAIALGLKQAKVEQTPLPIVLWTYGLINLTQLQAVFDWQNENH